LNETAVKQGMLTLQRSGIDLLKKGVTTLTEVAGALA